MSSYQDLERAHQGALRCAQLLRSLLIPAHFWVDAGHVCQVDGTDGDAADRISADIKEARQWVAIDRPAVKACSNALTVANKNLTPSGMRAGLKVGDRHYCHAHEAIVQTLAEVAIHLKVFSEDPSEAHFVDDDTVDEQMLRDNLADAFESLSHDACFLSLDELDLLVRDARQEFADATSRIVAASEPRRLSNEGRLVRHNADQAAVDEVVTIQEIATLAKVTVKTVNNLKSENPLPEPVVKSSGPSPAKYRYAEVKAWADAHWPARKSCFPSQFADAKVELSKRIIG
jgi:hypothetical protein